MNLSAPPEPAPQSLTSPTQDPGQAGLPLAVDLDGTFLLTDTLFEAIANRLRVRPVWTLLQLILLPFSIARIKARLSQAADVDVTRLPVNEEVLAYCRKAREAGREVVLASAADQSMVKAVADHFGVFTSIMASDGTVNNKGRNKAARLKAAYPNGFEYIGDSPADMKVWTAARLASHVDGGTARSAAIRARGAEVGAVFDRPGGDLRSWRKAMRLHQWAKNLLIFVAPILALKTSDPEAFIRCLLGFPLVGLMASGTYILNDLLDLNADRRHHSKNKRPFASGRIKLWQGFVAAPVLIIIGLVGAYLLSPAFLSLMAAYLVITLSYSISLKRIPLFDALLLGVLFTLRLFMGGALAGVAVTQWLIVFSMFLFFSLSLAKRHVEVLKKAEAGDTQVANRGYTARDAPLTLALGLAAATACPIILVLYLIDSAWPSGVYQAPDALWMAPLILSIWLMRVWLLANRAELDDDPVTFAIKDPASLGLGAALAASFLYAAFGSPSEAHSPETTNGPSRQVLDSPAAGR